MRQTAIAALLLILTSTQLLRPVTVHQPPTHHATAVVQHDHHSMAGMDHDCCPKLPVQVQIQLPASGPCDQQHRCCMASGEVPALQTVARQSKPDIDSERSSPNQLSSISLAWMSNSTLDTSPPCISRSTVLRI